MLSVSWSLCSEKYIFFFSLHILLLYVGLIQIIAQFLRQTNLCTNIISTSGHRFKDFLREFFFFFLHVTDSRKTVCIGWKLTGGDRLCQLHRCPVLLTSGLRVAQGTGRTSYNLLPPVPANPSPRCSFSSGTTVPAHSPARGTQVPRRQMLLLPHTFPELCWERQRRYQG